ncbi:hypothetical protein NDU88_005531 [Pleurodeles waltl]|uniref:Uncharacterized protein n=1 Tax=Pleurodeles waltl TaxID=8319 RepID=A0AAV7X1H3_PLEWA|nr:hypothetical protein NDU88_005531 [Pleurodeles waltl]
MGAFCSRNGLRVATGGTAGAGWLGGLNADSAPDLFQQRRYFTYYEKHYVRAERRVTLSGRTPYCGRTELV